MHTNTTPAHAFACIARLYMHGFSCRFVCAYILRMADLFGLKERQTVLLGRSWQVDLKAYSCPVSLESHGDTKR